MAQFTFWFWFGVGLASFLIGLALFIIGGDGYTENYRMVTSSMFAGAAIMIVVLLLRAGIF